MIALENRYVKPANAEGGLYVQLGEITRAELRAKEPHLLADRIAYRNGYNPAGRRTIGMPVWDAGAGTYRLAIWFHQEIGR